MPEITEKELPQSQKALWLKALSAVQTQNHTYAISLIQAVLKDHPGTTLVTLLVGPEGDFSAEETAAALTAGFLPISLGSIVLRVDTATLFCLSALRYEFEAT